MKKYRLIKTYPGSPELNTELIQLVDDNYFSSYPEYWEEIKSLNYQIITLKSSLHEQHFMLNTKTGYYHIMDPMYEERYFVSQDIINQKNTIFSVESIKRLSDNEIFNVGDRILLNNDNSVTDNEIFNVDDRILLNNDNSVTIESFFIDGNLLFIKHGRGTTSINQIVKLVNSF
jgi:hypothetical protein